MQKKDIINEIKIKKIRYIGKIKTNNISVKNNKNFLLSNGILTHNTMLLQAAMRAQFESTAEQTRFILTANYPQKIIDPIKSRCQLFEFKSFTREQIAKRLEEILNIEKISYNSDDVLEIATTCYPDIRKAINTIQKFSVDNKLTIDKTNISDSINSQIFNLLKKKDWKSIRKLMSEESVIYQDLYKYLFENIDTISTDPTALVLIADYQYRSSLVADQDINMISLIVQLCEEKIK